MEKQMHIPTEYQQLCKDIAKGLRTFNMEKGWTGINEIDKEKTIYRFHDQLSINDRDMSDIHFHWENGRHGDSQEKNIT